LLGVHGHEVVLVRAAGELPFDLALAPPQQEGGEPPVEVVQVLVAHGPAAVVELVVVPVEAEQGPEEGRVEELDD